MRSRRRFSTSGLSICDQRERESGPTGPRLSAAAPASGSRRWESPLPPLAQDPRLTRAEPIRSTSAPPAPTPTPLGSASVARLLSLPDLLHSPLSVSSSLLPSLCLSSFLATSRSRAVSVSVENFGDPLCAQASGPHGAGLRAGGPECRKGDT
uniref:Uncharacterized protein n=1 Tax=Urocitellus parryii TaxID=9999 RepID=A0A8D2HZR7_UROPR